MPEASEFAKEYLQNATTMQLATVVGDQPWVCTVRYLIDEHNALYWASLPTRRHSQEIAINPKVAVTVVIQDILDKPIKAVQMEGMAELLDPSLHNREIVERYASTYDRDKQWIDDFTAGRTEHRLYKFTPTKSYLIDEENFPDGKRHRLQ